MITQEQANWFAETFGKLAGNVEQAVMGKRQTVELSLACMLSEGHLLLEDVPGTGKTSLAKAIANTVRGTHSRIQFTPDLLPGDVTGSTVFNQKTLDFEFRPGPIFASIVLADEVNRASPKTQSALLEVMEEGKVTIDGTPHDVGVPFMVIATQNPIEQAGTYRLPEAQLDRFLIRASLGYPDHETAVALLADASNRNRAAGVQALIAGKAVSDMSLLATTVNVDTSVLGYVNRLAEETRRSPDVKLGVSMRGALSMVRMAKTWAASRGRTYVLPDDVKDLAPSVFCHRILLTPEAEFAHVTAAQVVSRALGDVAPPHERGIA